MSESEAHIRARQGYPCELRHDMLKLHIIRLEELAPCRDIVEKISYAEICTTRSRDLLCRYVCRVRKFHLTANLVLFTSGLEGNLRHGCDGGQRLSAESEGQYVMQIFCTLKLGGGVPLETEDCLVRRHSASVVDDLDESPSCVLDDDGHLVGTGIHRVLHQLLHHGRRSLNDLSRGYHICYIAW